MASGINNFSYGMYLLTTCENGRDYGCLVNAAIQVSGQPTRIAVCIVKRNLTHEVLLRTGRFNFCAITEDAPFALFRNFGMTSSRKTDKFSTFPGLSRSKNGMAYLAEYANMYLSVTVTEQVDLGDHTLFIGEVTQDVVVCDKPSCTYDYYLKHIVPKKT
ncbi:MAG: flavin reductase [Oscillospiraceae bacterium]|nr:flavin reductase [Oscillospiraceae bacterium]